MTPPNPPSPELFFQTVNAYHRTEALRAAIDLGLFTAIGSGAETSTTLATKISAAERGVRILSDYLVLMGFLTREDGHYKLTADTATFLDSKSPYYLGGATKFLLNPLLHQNFAVLADAVRKGGTATGQGTVSPEHPVWMDFAREMAPVTGMPAKMLSELVDRPADAPLSVLDIAASHGLFGLAFAKKFPKAKIFAQDWANVLTVASENAKKAGVSDRYSLVPGSAFEVNLGKNHDVVLITNFLHHFDRPTCVSFLRRVRESMAPKGVCLTLEFIVNEDRLTPPAAAGFALIMLASTPSGDSYTFNDLSGMLQEAGFSRSTLKELMPGMQQAVISER